MSLPMPPDFDLKAKAALLHLDAHPELRRLVWGAVADFFSRNPEIERTEIGAAFVACALLDAWGSGEEAKIRPRTKAA